MQPSIRVYWLTRGWTLHSIINANSNMRTVRDLTKTSLYWFQNISGEVPLAECGVRRKRSESVKFCSKN